MSKPVFHKLFQEDRAEMCRRLLSTIAPTHKLFRNEAGDYIFMHPLWGPRVLSGVDQFFGALPDLVELKVVREGIEVPASFHFTDARFIFASEHATVLPLLRKGVVLEPVILFEPDGTLSLSKPGYNPLHGVYYFLPPPATPLEPSDSTHHLETCFRGVPFEKTAYRNNILAYLLGAVVFDATMDAPLLSITGNNRGIGKSSLAQAVGHILTGSTPAPLDATRGEEFAKQIGTRFNEGSRFIFIDNITRTDGRSFHNERLAAMLTQGYSKSVRQLGYSRSVSQTGVLFCLTMNDGKLDTDLATRSLAVKLYADISKPMEPYVRDYALEHRRAIYSELLGLALRGPPLSLCSEHPQFRFRKWLSFVTPRIEPSFGPLAISEVSSLDDLSQELFQWGRDNADKEFGAAQFLEAVTHSAGAGLPRYPCLSDKFLNIISLIGRLASAGKFLAAHQGQVEYFEQTRGLTLTLVKPSTKGSGASYKFVEVA